MKVHFLTTARPHVASARFRAYWPCEAWSSPDVTVGGPDHPAIAQADVLIVSALINEATVIRSSPAPITVWDLTDPLWCYLGDRAFREMAAQMTHLTVSSEGLRAALATEFGTDATLIPDRLPFQTTQRQHQAVDVPTLIWFGYAFNRYPALSGVAPVLKRLLANGVKFKLQIVDDQPNLPLYEADRYGLAAVTEHVRWESHEQLHALLCAADVALLPPFPGWIGTMKSTNRFFTAAWAALPVVDGTDYRRLESLLRDADRRGSAGWAARAYAECYGNLTHSIEDWQQLLGRLTHAAAEAR